MHTRLDPAINFDDGHIIYGRIHTYVHLYKFYDSYCVSLIWWLLQQQWSYLSV